MKTLTLNLKMDEDDKSLLGFLSMSNRVVESLNKLKDIDAYLNLSMRGLTVSVDFKNDIAEKKILDLMNQCRVESNKTTGVIEDRTDRNNDFLIKAFGLASINLLMILAFFIN